MLIGCEDCILMPLSSTDKVLTEPGEVIVSPTIATA